MILAAEITNGSGETNMTVFNHRGAAYQVPSGKQLRVKRVYATDGGSSSVAFCLISGTASAGLNSAGSLAGCRAEDSYDHWLSNGYFQNLSHLQVGMEYDLVLEAGRYLHLNGLSIGTLKVTLVCSEEAAS